MSATEERCPECRHPWSEHRHTARRLCLQYLADADSFCSCPAAPPSPGEPDPDAWEPTEGPGSGDDKYRFRPATEQASSGGLPGGPEPSDGLVTIRSGTIAEAWREGWRKGAGDDFADAPQADAERWERIVLASTASELAGGSVRDRIEAGRRAAAPPSPGPDGRRLAEALDALREIAALLEPHDVAMHQAEAGEAEPQCGCLGDEACAEGEVLNVVEAALLAAAAPGVPDAGEGARTDG